MIVYEVWFSFGFRLLFFVFICVTDIAACRVAAGEGEEAGNESTRVFCFVL